MSPGWTPYSLGTWRWTPAGLTWVSYEPWGWLPYHYGTWAWDAAGGWIWIPGSQYAPAWVYWSYTPEWTGWCPVGWYGYYDSYYRSTRTWYGNERGRPWLPRLRGRVEITQIDRRGWNFAPTSHLGTRLDPAHDVVRGDRVSFPRGQTAVVATAPLRVARGSNPASSVQEAIRRITLIEAPARGGTNQGLTSILRRESVLDAAGQEELRRSAARAGRDPGVRTAGPDAPRRTGRDDSWRDAARRAAVPRGEGARGSETRIGRADEGWRAPSSLPPGAVERRSGEGHDRQGDSGWRAPAPRVIERSSGRPAGPRDDGSRTEIRREAPRVREAPVREAPVRPMSVHSAPAPPHPPAAAPAQAPPSRRDH